MTNNRWPADIAADRLAEYLAEVLDYVGRVDQAVTTADLFYLADKGRSLVRAAQRLTDLADELVAERTPVAPYAAQIEDKLIRTGAMGYRVIQKLHPDPNAGKVRAMLRGDAVSEQA